MAKKEKIKDDVKSSKKTENKENLEAQNNEVIENKEETIEQDNENTEEKTEKEEKTDSKEEQESTNEESEKSEYDILKDKHDEITDKYARLSAEFDNYRKRTLKEKMDLIQSGGSDVLKNILPVLDNVERAIKSMNESSDLEAVKDGIELIYKNFLDFLKQRGVTEIKAIGEKFDTDKHEAIAQMPAEKKKQKGNIIDVIEKGYKLNDKILRFAKVVVAQ